MPETVGWQKEETRLFAAALNGTSWNKMWRLLVKPLRQWTEATFGEDTTAPKRAQIEDFRFDLRHTFGTRLVQGGVDLYKGGTVTRTNRRV